MNVIKLFDYQEDMKERIEKALRLHRSVMAQMPTGTGKTVLLASVVESFLREHSNCNVWIVAHRRELVSQIRETIQRVFSKTPSLLYKDFSNHPVNSSKITPSLFTLKEGSTSHPDPLTLRGEGGNRPTRCCICPTCPSPAGGSLTHSQGGCVISLWRTLFVFSPFSRYGTEKIVFIYNKAQTFTSSGFAFPQKICIFAENFFKYGKDTNKI